MKNKENDENVKKKKRRRQRRRKLPGKKKKKRKDGDERAGIPIVLFIGEGVIFAADRNDGS